MSRTGLRLEYHHMVKFQTDSCLECKGMRTINVSELISHLSTDFAREHLTSLFEMGCASRAYAIVVSRSKVNLITREVLGKVIIGGRHN